MEQKNKFIYILPVMFGFFIMGFCDLVGISVTYAKEQFQWTETQAGFLPSMVFLWFFILSVPTAMLMNRIGRKNTVLLSMLFTFAGMVLPISVKPPVMLRLPYWESVIPFCRYL